MMKIESIVIRGVRGIRDEMKLELKGRSLLLHGDNGSGKSSIERALRWALTGQERPTDEEPFTTESSYRRHVEVEPDYPMVEVRLDESDYVRVTPTEYESTDAAAAYVAACQRGIPFLRRVELLDVLTQKPVERFQYLESFLGFEHVDDTVRGIAAARDTMAASLARGQRGYAAQIGALRPLLPAPRQSQSSTVDQLVEQAIAAVVDVRLVAPGSMWDEANSAVLGFSLDDGEESLAARSAAMSELADAFSAFRSSLPSELPDPLELEGRRRNLESVVVDSAQASTIEHALAHFRTAEGDSCPVCQQPVDWQRTMESLEQRSRDLVEYLQLVRDRDAAADGWLRVWRGFLAHQERLARFHPADKASLAALAEMPAKLSVLHEQAEYSAEEREAMVALGSEALVAYLANASASARRLTAGGPSPSQLPQIRLIASLFQRMGEALPGIRRLERENIATERRHAHVIRLHDALKRARQDVARETLAEIGERVSEYYRFIHPADADDESTGAPSVVVQRHGRGTAFVRGEFADKEVKNPKWVYSDGHLDTVGLCLFLALRRYRADEADDAKLLVLDDVVVSIDLGHARRLIELLKEKFADHQILLLTHNGLFAHWCANLIPGLRRLQIKRWSLAAGPQVGDYGQAKEQLQQSMDGGVAKEVALGLMWLMDEWLGEARFAYQVSVPAKPDERYTLTDIWNPFAKVIKRLGLALDSGLGGAVDLVRQLHDLPAIRNALSAHENEFAREFPRAVVVETARKSVGLVEALYCDGCCTFARPVPDRFNPSIVHCHCRRLRYIGEESTSGSESAAV
ncbi:MAG: AAA family ATPase [Cyanobacteria bacterium HKST-UBA02]|nr:AAA family ATPase [Cyanobacteria bacterium HKST-UBA02]